MNNNKQRRNQPGGGKENVRTAMYINTSLAANAHTSSSTTNATHSRTEHRPNHFRPPAPPRFGRGIWVNRKDDDNIGERYRGFRKAARPLVPENKAELERWIPRVMSPGDVVDIAKQCIQVTDEFIKLDSFLDRNKRYNSSNLDQLRHEQRMCQQQVEVKPDNYVELIAQCQANPGVFPGTQYCLELLFGPERLAEYVRQRAWTEETLREWNITTDWEMYHKKIGNEE